MKKALIAVLIIAAVAIPTLARRAQQTVQMHHTISAPTWCTGQEEVPIRTHKCVHNLYTTCWQDCF